MNTKQLQVAGLTALIVMTWGYAAYNWVNPPKAYLGQEDKVALEFLLDNACPFLKEQYNEIEEVDGQKELLGAVEIFKQCEARLQAAQFYDVLVNEFSKQEHRQ